MQSGSAQARGCDSDTVGTLAAYNYCDKLQGVLHREHHQQRSSSLHVKSIRNDRWKPLSHCSLHAVFLQKLLSCCYSLTAYRYPSCTSFSDQSAACCMSGLVSLSPEAAVCIMSSFSSVYAELCQWKADQLEAARCRWACSVRAAHCYAFMPWTSYAPTLQPVQLPA